MTDVTAGYCWPAGNRLSRDLHLVIDCAGRRIVDLGCGTGQCGRRAKELGASVVVFADGNPTAVAALGADAVLHQWGDPIPGAPYDLILGGDILYRPQCFAALLHSVSLGLARQGIALLADPRPVLEPELPDLAQAAGLTWTVERRSDYTLATLTPLP